MRDQYPVPTPKEQQVLEALYHGKKSRDIAIALGISCSTVHTHKQNLFVKYDAHNTTSLVVTAINLNLIGRTQMVSDRIQKSRPTEAVK